MSTSKVAEYRNLKEQLETLLARKNEVAAQAEAQMDFLKGLEEGAAKVGLTKADVAEYLSAKPFKARKSHKPRALKVYVNPNTQERIETKGGNHKILKAWKGEHGSDVVEGWRQ